MSVNVLLMEVKRENDFPGHQSLCFLLLFSFDFASFVDLDSHQNDDEDEEDAQDNRDADDDVEPRDGEVEAVGAQLVSAGWTVLNPVTPQFRADAGVQPGTLVGA